MVVEPTGVCIEGASVEVVAGERAGLRATQETPCSAWGYSGGVELGGLTPGVELTLRATAPGWTTQEKTFFPRSGWYSVSLLALTPVQ